MKKLISVETALTKLKSGMTIMIGGFLSQGMALTIIDALTQTGVNNLKVITNDPGKPDVGVGKLIRNRQIKKLIASHVGLNPEAGCQMQEESLELQLVPQGTLLEQIRCGGFGLGGFLTPVGLGTLVATGKEIIEVQGQEYLLELPLRADVAIIKAYKGDSFGNLTYRGTSQNYNPIMAYAADLVIAEVENLVEVGELDPNEIRTSGVLVDFIVVKG